MANTVFWVSKPGHSARRGAHSGRGWPLRLRPGPFPGATSRFVSGVDAAGCANGTGGVWGRRRPSVSTPRVASQDDVGRCRDGARRPRRRRASLRPTTELALDDGRGRCHDDVGRREGPRRSSRRTAGRVPADDGRRSRVRHASSRAAPWLVAHDQPRRSGQRPPSWRAMAHVVLPCEPLRPSKGLRLSVPCKRRSGPWLGPTGGLATRPPPAFGSWSRQVVNAALAGRLHGCRALAVRSIPPHLAR